jgi:hypothetical protein
MCIEPEQAAELSQEQLADLVDALEDEYNNLTDITDDVGYTEADIIVERLLDVEAALLEIKGYMEDAIQTRN